jgi:hypothetical protein
MEWIDIMRSEPLLEAHTTACRTFLQLLESHGPSFKRSKQLVETMNSTRALIHGIAEKHLHPIHELTMHAPYLYERPNDVRLRFNPSLLQSTTAAYLKIVDAMRNKNDSAKDTKKKVPAKSTAKKKA